MNNANVIILAAAAAGLLLNTLAILGMAWKGGILYGGMKEVLADVGADVKAVAAEVKEMQKQNQEHAIIQERTVTQLTELERRVAMIERRHG